MHHIPHFAFSHADLSWLSESWLADADFCRLIKSLLVWYQHYPSRYFSFKFPLVILNLNWQNLQSLSTRKDTPSTHHPNHLSFPPPQSFPHRCAEGMERMCCCVGLRFACSFSCPVLPWFQQRRLPLQSPLKSPFNSPTLWHTSFCFSPRTCGMPFPKTAYQQTVWHHWTKLIFFPQCFFFNRHHGSVYTCFYTWSKVFTVLHCLCFAWYHLVWFVAGQCYNKGMAWERLLAYLALCFCL